MINEKASLVQIPSGYKSGTLYSVVPNTSAGDFTVTGDPQGEATRVNKDGLIESVAADVPRLNYDPSNPQDPHLLLEPQRINIYTYSQDLNQGTTLTNTSVDNDNTTSPDGSLTGNKLTQTSGAFTRKNLGVVLSGTYAWSFFAKKGDLRYLNARSLFVLNGTTPANGNTIIDLDTNTIAYKGTNVTSASIEQYPNDWIKVEIVATDNATGSGDFVDFFFTDSDTSTQSTGVAGNGFIWGVQFEAGSYPTSYIPTTIAVTRIADFISNSYTGLTSASGTIFIDLNTKGFDFNFAKIIALRDTVTGDSLRLEPFDNSGTKKFAFFGINGSSATPPSEDILPINNRKKIALTFENGNFKYASDGVITTGTYSGTARQYNQIGGANITGGAMHNGIIHQFMVFNEALTDAELITLTT